MSKRNMQRIMLWIVMLSIINIIAIAMLWSPRGALKVIGNDNDIIEKYDKSNIIGYSGCYVASDGQIIADGYDSHIVFNESNFSAKTIIVKFANPVEKSFDVQLYLKYGDEFNENDSIVRNVSEGETSVGFEISDDDVKQIRMDIDSNYNLDCVEVHENSPILQLNKDNTHSERIVYGVIIAVVLGVILIFLDIKFGISDKFFRMICKYSRLIIRDILICFASLICGYILSMIFGRFEFNYCMWAFCTAIVAVGMFAFVCRNSIKEKPEKLMIRMILISSITMLVISPIGHISWDIDSHFRFALESSSFASVGISEPELAVITNDTNFLSVAEDYTQNLDKIELLNKNDDVIVKCLDSDIRLSSLLSGIVIAVLRLFGASFFVIYKFGQLPIIIVYALCCYFAMRRLHSGKMILAVIAMFPTSLFIASNYSYDTWVIGFAMLGMAYFVGNCQEEGVISTRDTIVMVGSFSLAIIPKQIYLAFLVIPFLMRRKKIENKKRYYGICSMAFVIMLLDLISRMLFVTSQGGDFRGGADVNALGQMLYIIHNPIEYMHTLVKFLSNYLSVKNVDLYIDNFAYLGLGAKSVAFIILLCMIFTAITDKKECDVKAYGKIVWAYGIIVYFGTAALIATSLYVAFTAVGALTILGCQPRYIIPLIYPVLSVIGMKGIAIKINYKIYNYCILGIMQIMVFVCLYQKILIRVL